jgi:hypothetical protein
MSDYSGFSCITGMQLQFPVQYTRFTHAHSSVSNGGGTTWIKNNRNITDSQGYKLSRHSLTVLVFQTRVSLPKTFLPVVEMIPSKVKL